MLANVNQPTEVDFLPEDFAAGFFPDLTGVSGASAIVDITWFMRNLARLARLCSDFGISDAPPDPYGRD
jgi:hypothetical protein